MALSGHVPDLSALELLLAVARSGSIGAAGRQLGLSQQAVSARIRSVERQVGVPLLRRDPRGSRLTEDGALLVDWATPVLEAARGLDAAIGALRASERDLEVVASHTVAEFLLPGWLVRLREEVADGIGVRVRVLDSAAAARAVLDGSAAVGFVEDGGDPDGLRSATVATDELVAVVDPDHPWARQVAVPLRDLAATALVTREPGAASRSVLDAAIAAAAPDAERPEPAARPSATTAVREAVMAGRGPAVLSRLAVDDDIEAGRLVAVPVTGVPAAGGPDGGGPGATWRGGLVRELRAIWTADTAPTGPARTLLRIATEGRIR